jgi:hypothetical protein
VTEHARRLNGIETFDKMQITVAETGIRGTQQYLMRLWLRYLEGLDGHGLMSFVEDGRPHRSLLPAN